MGLRRGHLIDMGLTLLIFWSLFELSAGAEDFLQDCKEAKDTIDLRKELGPIRDQGSLGWCYAYTSVDIMDQYINKNRKSMRIERFGNLGDPQNQLSPSFVSMSYRHPDRPDPSQIRGKAFTKAKAQGEKISKLWAEFEQTDTQKKKDRIWAQILKLYEHHAEGGSTELAINQLIEKPYLCLESDVSSKDYSLNGTQQFYGLDQAIYYSYVYDRSGSQFCRAADSLQKLFPRKSEDEIIDSLREAEPYTGLLKSKGLCTFKNPLKKRITAVVHLGEKEALASIDTGLSKGYISGISYTANFLLYNQTMEGEHASTIVGKRVNCKTKKIDYLLRNSWGATACANEKTKFIANNKMPKFDCTEDGYYIVDAKVLERNLIRSMSLVEGAR